MIPHPLEQYKGRRILIAPLNWGLGHATRCTSIIKSLSKYNQVSIASDGLALDWLRQELGSCYRYHLLPSYNVKYDQTNTWINLLKYGPYVWAGILKENKKTASIAQKEGIDLIISDHRLGVRTQNIESILIAHQLKIPHENSFISRLTSKVQQHYVNQFDQCWIPDYKDVRNRLSGVLSEPNLKIDKQFIGPLSHMTTYKKSDDDSSQERYDVAIILSGLEPTRSRLEKKLNNMLSQIKDLKMVFVRGTKLPLAVSKFTNITYHDFLSTRDMSTILSNSRVIISRSGYSSIMDLEHLKKGAILIPTPNQPEQEYLADLHNARDRFICILEQEISREKLHNSILQLLQLSK